HRRRADRAALHDPGRETPHRRGPDRRVWRRHERLRQRPTARLLGRDLPRHQPIRPPTPLRQNPPRQPLAAHRAHPGRPRRRPKPPPDPLTPSPPPPLGPPARPLARGPRLRPTPPAFTPQGVDGSSPVAPAQRTSGRTARGTCRRALYFWPSLTRLRTCVESR